MSRWTPKPRGRNSGDQPDASSDDFTSMFGASSPDEIPPHSRLHEPRSADRYVRGRTRLTVRQLMEQMNAAEEQSPQAENDPPTQKIRARPRRTVDSTPATPDVETPPATTPPGPPRQRSRPQPPADDQPTTALPVTRGGVPSRGVPSRGDSPVGNDVTQKIPAVGENPDAVDLSDKATAERVVEESRAQGSHAAPVAGALAGANAAPLERTPELPATMSRSAPRRLAARTRKQSVRRRATVTGRILVAVACVMALVGTGFVWGYLKTVNGSWRTIVAVDPDDSNIRNKDAQYGDENYLIVGTDTRGGKNSQVGAGTTADAEGARSDTIILVNIPADRSRVVAVSFPRDLQVDRPECQQWDNEHGTYSGTLPAESSIKLNSVYADGGPQCLVRVLTQMSGLNINHFIAMDFYGFEKVVDAVGGVQVCSTVPLYDYELGQILKRPGKQTVTGRKALNYVRARTISTEGNGDYGRIKRQQLFMSSLLRSTLSGNVLTNPAKLNSIVNTFIRYSYVDGVDTQSLLKLAESMQGIEAGRVTFLTIPTSGTATDGSNNELPRTDDINAIFDAIINDQPLPGEQAERTPAGHTSPSSSASPSSASPTTPATTSRTSATAQNPGNVGVRVLNGTGRTGAASEVSDQFTALGFDVRGVADASENRTNTVIRYGVGEKDSAATLAEMFPDSVIQLDKTVRSGVEVILGSAFTGTVGSAPSAGTTLSVSELPAAVNTGSLPNDLAVTNAGDTTCA